MRREQDPYDWFVEEDPQGTRQDQEPARSDPDHTLADDWLNETSAPRRSPPALGAIDRRVVVVVGLLLVILLAGLAAGGVFSGSGARVASPPAPSATGPTTTTPTTTQQPTSPLRAPSTTLTPGASGAQVRVLQRGLAGLGFSTGRIDGQYGPATKAALARFQRSVQLTADGILGPSTLRALKTALNGP